MSLPSTDTAGTAGSGTPRPDGLALFRHWLDSEAAQAWDGLDPAAGSGYEKVWTAWLRSLDAPRPAATARRPAPPARPWHEATAVDVQHFLKPRKGQLSHHLPDRQLSEVTRRRYWRLLERIYDHALAQGWVNGNPAAGLAPQERPAAEDGRGHCLPAPLWHALPRHIPAADGFQAARDRAILLLLYELALAPEEVRSLQWSDVQPVDARQALDGDAPAQLLVQGMRAAQRRTLPLPDVVLRALLDWRSLSAGQRGPAMVQPGATVFYSREGQPLSVRVLFHVASQLIQRAHAAQDALGQKTPLHRVGPQVLRNTAIVQWLRAGHPETEVAQRIGVDGARALRHLRHYLQPQG